MAQIKGKQIKDDSLDLEKLRSGSKILPNTATLGSDKDSGDITDPREFTTKDYVDTEISTNTTNATNGLTKVGNYVKLGGSLTEHTTISGNTRDLSLSTRQFNTTTTDQIYLETADTSGNTDNTIQINNNSVDMTFYNNLTNEYSQVKVNNNYASMFWDDGSTTRGEIKTSSDSVGISTGYNFIYANLKTSNLLTTNRNFEFPDQSGTLALLSDISASALTAGDGLSTTAGSLNVNVGSGIAIESDNVVLDIRNYVDADAINITSTHSSGMTLNGNVININSTSGNMNLTSEGQFNLSPAGNVTISSTGADFYIGADGTNQDLRLSATGAFELNASDGIDLQTASNTELQTNDLTINAFGANGFLMNTTDVEIQASGNTAVVSGGTMNLEASGNTTLISNGGTLLVQAQGDALTLQSQASNVNIIANSTVDVDSQMVDITTTNGDVNITTTNGNVGITTDNFDVTTTNAGNVNFAIADDGMFNVATGGTGYVNIVGADNTNIEGGESYIYLDNNGVYINADSDSTAHTFELYLDAVNGAATFTDGSATQAGLQYAGDYSLNYTDRSLVDKAYVDTLASGLDPKASVRFATTANLSWTYNEDTSGTVVPAPGSQDSLVKGSAITSVDFDSAATAGFTLQVGDRILVRAQTDPKQNGIYEITDVSTGTIVRASDQDGSPTNEVSGGNYTFVENGTYANLGFTLQGDGVLTLNTDDMIWVQFSGAGQIVAGSGLSKTANTLNVNTGNGIQIIADAVALDVENYSVSTDIEMISTGGDIIMTSNTGIFQASGDSVQINSSNADVQINSGANMDLTANSGYIQMYSSGVSGGAYIYHDSNGITIDPTGFKIESFDSNDVDINAQSASINMVSSTISGGEITMETHTVDILAHSDINLTDISGNHTFNLNNSNGATYTDNSADGGIKYAADYSGNFVARSLVDKAYVDNKVANTTTTAGDGLVGNSTSGVISVNPGSGIAIESDAVVLDIKNYTDSDEISLTTYNASGMVFTATSGGLTLTGEVTQINSNTGDLQINAGNNMDLSSPGYFQVMSAEGMYFYDNSNGFNIDSTGVYTDISNGSINLTASGSGKNVDIKSNNSNVILTASSGTIEMDATTLDAAFSGSAGIVGNLGVSIGNTYGSKVVANAVGVTIGAGIGTAAGTSGKIIMNFDSGSSIVFNGTSGNKVLVNAGTSGLLYEADYSTNYTSRSLVDKAYVDGVVNTSVSDGTYGTAWNGVTTTAPSKNAVYDKIETMVSKTTGGVQFDFVSSNYLAITNDNGAYAQSHIDMTSSQLDIGFGSTSQVRAGNSNTYIQYNSKQFGVDNTSPYIMGTGGWLARVNTSLFSANRSFEFPNANGTLALTSDLSGYLPITGSDLSVDATSSINLNVNGGGGNENMFYVDTTVAALYHIGDGGSQNANVEVGDFRAYMNWENTTDTAIVSANTSGIGISTILGTPYYSFLRTDNITNDRTYQLPDANGTIALTSDIAAITLTEGNGIDITSNVVSLDIQNYTTSNQIQLTSSSSDIQLTGQTAVYLTSNNGPIEVVSNNGRIGLDSYGGNIEFTTVNGDNIQMITNGGNISANVGGGGNVVIQGDNAYLELNNFETIVENGDTVLIHGGSLVTIDADTTLEINSSNTTYTDLANGGGIKYAADYSADYTDRSLVDKAYVDTLASGLDPKESVRFATTDNLSWTYNEDTSGTVVPSPGSQDSLVKGSAITSVDFDSAATAGFTLQVGDRILVRTQTDPKQNGIYEITNLSTGTIVRASDQDGSPTNEVSGGNYTFVENGTYANLGFVLQGDGILTLNTDDMTWVQFSGAGQITAGSGLSKTANTLNVNTGSGIAIESDAVVLDISNYSDSDAVNITTTNSTSGINLTATNNSINLNATSINATGSGFIVNTSSASTINASHITLDAVVNTTIEAGNALTLNGGFMDINSSAYIDVDAPSGITTTVSGGNITNTVSGEFDITSTTLDINTTNGITMDGSNFTANLTNGFSIQGGGVSSGSISAQGLSLSSNGGNGSFSGGGNFSFSAGGTMSISSGGGNFTLGHGGGSLNISGGGNISQSNGGSVTFDPSSHFTVTPTDFNVNASSSFNANIIGQFNVNSSSLSLASSSGTYTDASGTNGGLQYAADYSSTYTSRSLVDKAYVDGAVSDATLTDGNGITITSNTIHLGGNIDANTTLGFQGTYNMNFDDINNFTVAGIGSTIVTMSDVATVNITGTAQGDFIATDFNNVDFGNSSNSGTFEIGAYGTLSSEAVNVNYQSGASGTFEVNDFGLVKIHNQTIGGTIDIDSMNALVNDTDVWFGASNSIELESDSTITLTSSNAILHLNGGGTYTDVAGTNGGLQYAADYSSTYTSRSLVDKAYVDGLVSGSSLNEFRSVSVVGGATTAGTSGFVAYSGSITFPANAITDAEVFINGIKIDIPTDAYFGSAGNAKPQVGQTVYFDITSLGYEIESTDKIQITYLT